MASRFFSVFVLAGVVATCFAQQQCGCQQQPTVIQLSCGNGGKGPIGPPPGHPPPPPPPPAFQEPASTAAYPPAEPPAEWESPPAEPPAEGWEAPAGPPAGPPAGWETPAEPPAEGWEAPAGPPAGWESPPAEPPADGWEAPAEPPAEGWEAPAGPPAGWETPAEPPAAAEPAEEHRWSMHEDMDRHKCIFDTEGYPFDYNGINYSDLRFPDGFRIDWESNDAEVPAGLPVPPKTWDGYPETLGFPLPEKGTELYNMLLCFPYQIDAGMAPAPAG